MKDSHGMVIFFLGMIAGLTFEFLLIQTTAGVGFTSKLDGSKVLAIAGVHDYLVYEERYTKKRLTDVRIYMSDGDKTATVSGKTALKMLAPMSGSNMSRL